MDETASERVKSRQTAAAFTSKAASSATKSASSRRARSTSRRKEPSMAAKRVISRPMPDAAPVITMAGCKSFASLAVTLGAMSQSMQLALSTKARRSVQLGRCVGLGNSPALKSDDAAALRGGRHLDDLGLLAELA